MENRRRVGIKEMKDLYIKEQEIKNRDHLVTP